MKPIDLSKLNYQRLQKYRKSLTDKQHDLDWDGNVKKDVSDELKRVLEECNRRNKVIITQQKKDKWAHVPNIK
jgi:hypothetical protein